MNFFYLISDAADKAGECPQFLLKCAVHVGGCMNDYECTGDKKCCQIDCTVMKCTNPVFSLWHWEKHDKKCISADCQTNEKMLQYYSKLTLYNILIILVTVVQFSDALFIEHQTKCNGNMLQWCNVT